jgi:predicted alpha/beta-hydrolase family hydrolase
MTRVARGLADRGVTVVTFDFPYIEAKRRVPDPAPKLEDAFCAVWLEVAASARGKIFAGGKSMGGRISSQAAARGLLDPSPAGLVFFGYPLHPPGKPAQRRDRHLPAVGAPMLFLQGERDPFGTPDEMRGLVARLSGARLEIIDEGDHSLVRPKRADPRGESIDHALDLAAAWITR